MSHDFLYMFECDYSSRTQEKKFIKDILNHFDKDYATMVGLVVNNNPYCLSFHVAVNLQKDPVYFEQWLRDNYPEKIKRHNMFVKDILPYNVVTLLNAEMVDLFITANGGGHPFLWSERDVLEKEYPQYIDFKKREAKVFLSHSSLDKNNIVFPLHSYLQANDVATWLDTYEIDYGDNIVLKVNEGIDKADIGLFILTDNFFAKRSGWPLAEFTTFFMSLMNSDKKILMIDAGVSPENMLPMMKSYRYLRWDNGSGLPEIANAVKRIMAK